ncbi:MAG: N-acetyltransferase family protein [Bdellovibrionales bacterium]
MSSIQLSDGSQLNIRFAKVEDVPLVLSFIRELAEYEKLSHEVVTNEVTLQRTLFGERKYAEALIGERDGKPVTFAIFFHNFSSFNGKPGIYLEDLFVKPEVRSLGIGKRMLARLAQLAEERDCVRFEWAVLDWNQPAITFYQNLGAKPLDTWIIYRLVGDALRALAKFIPPQRIK